MTKGMQALAIVAARGITFPLLPTARLFAFRCHATPIRTPKQMRNTLVYVLNNWRKHGEDRGRVAKIDPYSTAIWFGGWKGVGRFTWTKTFEPLPMNPTTFLLTEGWLRDGAIDPHERPKVKA